MARVTNETYTPEEQMCLFHADRALNTLKELDSPALVLVVNPIGDGSMFVSSTQVALMTMPERQELLRAIAVYLSNPEET